MIRQLQPVIAFQGSTNFRQDVGSAPAVSRYPVTGLGSRHPSLVITKRLKSGTPVRGACPVCEVEFSTEAFDRDRSYPHESKLEQWYAEHFQCHLSDDNG